MDVPGYLHRLGLGDLTGQPPSLPALHALHTAHAERVPYEVLEIWLDRPTTIDPLDSARRIVAGRGGYCFHLNGAFAELLRALGYQVTRHVGGVQGSATDPAGATANHLVLTVTGLPAPQSPDGAWLVDLGMGDGLHAPLPLVAGDYEQGGFHYRLRPSEAEPGGWRFDHDPRGSFVGMDFRAEPTTMAAFADQHRHLSTSPESGFVRVATAARRDATGVDILRTLVLTRVGDHPARTELTTRSDYFTAMADIFGITFADVSPAGRDTLWSRLTTAHEQWLATKSPA
ncbi:arylamine N-acetyltransferase [Actinoplanes octamycinicus]|uniref:Arylamine N-acetyltransferase n=1 Tax=Actinoplanes octamycinicus TaxID=135948 RepID=A0A7W7M8T4_9ACTN|nr:arylamine N-acetyltransferase [Actinoplanes octamycinicus]MBB4741106.1 arylamine N-acetyltransferase [Actinoplanes octamycinicus]GIE56012.1 arylamine N-acetyltransferase [Actinoplanes octamycinicus]